MEEIINYIMETPENVNGNILREKLKDFQKSGSDDSVLASLIDKSITEIKNDSVTMVGDSAFYGCSDLTTVNLPNVTRIGKSAFYACYDLTTVNLPNVTRIGCDAFSDCSALTIVDLPNVTSINANAFNGISSTAVINLGAAEGEISGAPWGAPEGVTINYTDGSIIVVNR